MVSTRRRTATYKALIISSVLDHPLVWTHLGEGRYLQAAASKSLARVYSDRFGTSTSKSLSNEAAEGGSRTFLDWTRSIGCNWDESVFLSGVKGGRTEILQQLIDKGCQVPQGENACTCAAKEGRLEALMWLRERDFAWGEAVCTEAAARGNLPLLQWAREHECPWDGVEVLESAAHAGHLNILEWVHQQGVELTAELTAVAAAGGSLLVLEWLKAQDCPWSDSTVLSAAANGHCHVHVWLKRNGCPYDLAATDHDGAAALHLASFFCHKGMVRLLIEDGADINQGGQQNITSLHLAVAHNWCEIVQILLDAGAFVNALTETNTTPLLVAAGKGFPDSVRVLLRAGANTELYDTTGFVPLTAAIWRNHVDVVRALLEAGANPNHQTAESLSPLYWGCKFNRVEAVRALIDWGADVNKPNVIDNVSGIRPIHVAAKEGCAEVAAILLKSGADANVSTSLGETPLPLANDRGHTAVVDVLTAAGVTH